MTGDNRATSGDSTEEQKNVDIAGWIANAIADTGCTVVYGGHGAAVVPLVNAIVTHPSLTWVCARNEHDAATMASAHAKYTGQLGAVIGTSGPGATNLTTGLMEAMMDLVPLLAITGMKPRSELGYGEFQDVNQSRLFAGAGIEWSKDASSPEAVIPLLRDAVSTALSRKTCAHLAIPVDVQASPSPLPLRKFCAANAHERIMIRTVDVKLVEETAKTLVGTADESHPRILIAVGLRAVWCNADNTSDMSVVLLELAEALNAPVLTRLHAKGIVDESHPLSFGVVGVHGKPGLEAAASLISSSDIVLCIGVDDETLLACNAAGLQIRRVIEIEQDAFGVSTRFHAEHTIIGDIRLVCLELTKQVEALSFKISKQRSIKAAQLGRRSSSLATESDESAKKIAYVMQDNPFDGPAFPVEEEMTDEKFDEYCSEVQNLWNVLHCGNWRKLLDMEHRMRYRAEYKKESVSKKGTSFCHPAAILHELSNARKDKDTCSVARNATIAVDVGDVTLWASLCLCLQGGSRTLNSERLGTMGYALCAGIAAVLARPAPSAAVVLAGDGGFQMTLAELATFQQMKREGDRLLVIVFDNQILGRVAFGIENALGCEMTGPDYVALARAYGGDGCRVERSEDAKSVVRNSLTKSGLYLIHVIVDPEVKADMAAFHDNSLTVMNSVNTE